MPDNWDSPDGRTHFDCDGCVPAHPTVAEMVGAAPTQTAVGDCCAAERARVLALAVQIGRLSVNAEARLRAAVEAQP